jgi:hypothetical protein
MTREETDMMNLLLQEFEQRFRDSKKRFKTLSIESRYLPNEKDFPGCDEWKQSHVGDGQRHFGEDAMLIVLRAWGALGRKCPIRQSFIKVSFGIGANSQSEYESRLDGAFHRFGEAYIHKETDAGVFMLLTEIKLLAKKQYNTLFKLV